MGSKGTKIARVEDIPEGRGILVFGPNALDIALFKVKGEIFALENACPHMGGPLAEGDITHENCKNMVTCPWHGWQFDLRTGECETSPDDNVKKIEIQVEEGIVYLKK